MHELNWPGCSSLDYEEHLINQAFKLLLALAKISLGLPIKLPMSYRKVFIDSRVLMFKNALVEMLGCIANIICITQIYVLKDYFKTRLNCKGRTKIFRGGGEVGNENYEKKMLTGSEKTK